MKRKLKSQSGETLVETLFAMLVVVLAFTMLAGGIVAAARVNKGAQELEPAFRLEGQAVSGVKVKITHKDSTTSEVLAHHAYRTDDKNKYCYYD